MNFLYLVPLLLIPIASRMCGMTLTYPGEPTNKIGRIIIFPLAAFTIAAILALALNTPPVSILVFAAGWIFFRIWQRGHGFSAIGTDPGSTPRKRWYGMLWMTLRGLLIVPLFAAAGYYTGYIPQAITLAVIGAVWMGLSFRFAKEVVTLFHVPLSPSIYNIWAEWSEGCGWAVCFFALAFLVNLT